MTPRTPCTLVLRSTHHIVMRYINTHRLSILKPVAHQLVELHESNASQQTSALLKARHCLRIKLASGTVEHAAVASMASCASAVGQQHAVALAPALSTL